MSSEADTRDRLLETLDLFGFGIELMASNLRRRHPEATPAMIEQYLDAWLAAPSGGESGDDQRVVTDRYR